MKIKEFSDVLKENISAIYPTDEISGIVRIILEDIFDISYTESIVYPEKEILPNPELSFEMILKRLKTGEPVQYVCGITEFCGLKFKVDKNVLIPRPETEELVGIILSENLKYSPQILDIGTGSGCIAVSLKNKLPYSDVFAMDISCEALNIANENSKLNNAEIQFIEFDILNQTDSIMPELDIIVSNPPYVRLSEKKEMRENVLNFEPEIALFVKDDNSLIFYEKICDFAKINLKTGGKLYFEINEKLSQETIKLIENMGFEDVKLYKDIFDKFRFIGATK